MSNQEPPLTDVDQARLTRVWAGFQSVGGEAHSPDVSLSPLTLGADIDATLPPGLTTDDGTVQLGEGTLRPLGLGEGEEFQPRELLGRGGMGEVHVALDSGLHREVAVKTVGSQPTAQKRQALLQEALFTGHVEHPNVVPVHRLGSDADGRPAFVMKRVSGTSWRDLLKDAQHPGWSALPQDRLRANLEILTQVCHALHYAHSRGVLHRDVKPDNVMVGRFGEVYLLDWGLAVRIDQAAQAGDQVVGTLAYMAPEMLGEAEQVSPATDVYLLGATLHEVLTGETRHRGSAHYNVMLKVLRSAPVVYDDDVPRELAELCNAATAREPGRRPPSAQAFRERLERFLDHRGSIQLADEAHERLATLQAAYATGDHSATTATLFSECRFGFQQALAIWDANPSARDGLQVCLVQTIEQDLVAGRLGRAETLLAELPNPRPDLAERLAAAQAEAARAPARLQELEEEADFNIGARERARMTIGMTVATCGATCALPFFLQPRGPFPVSYPTFAGFALVLWALLLFSAWLGRGSYMRNMANRRMVYMISGGFLGCLNVMAGAWAYGFNLRQMFYMVGLVMIAVTIQMAIVVDKRIWVIVPLVTASGFLGKIDPDIDPLFGHGVVTGSALLIMCSFWLLDARREAQRERDERT